MSVYASSGYRSCPFIHRPDGSSGSMSTRPCLFLLTLAAAASSALNPHICFLKNRMLLLLLKYIHLFISNSLTIQLSLTSIIDFIKNIPYFTRLRHQINCRSGNLSTGPYCRSAYTSSIGFLHLRSQAHGSPLRTPQQTYFAKSTQKCSTSLATVPRFLSR